MSAPARYRTVLIILCDVRMPMRDLLFPGYTTARPCFDVTETHEEIILVSHNRLLESQLNSSRALLTSPSTMTSFRRFTQLLFMLLFFSGRVAAQSSGGLSGILSILCSLSFFKKLGIPCPTTISPAPKPSPSQPNPSPSKPMPTKPTNKKNAAIATPTAPAQTPN
jgi:hypothetical protein